MSGNDLVRALEAVNNASPFNRLAGFELVAAEAGTVRLAGAAAADLMNHAGALHAGVQCALLDTASGYAAGTVGGNVVTLQLTTQFLASAKGDRFEARARVTKAGKAQIFTEAQLYAWRGSEEVLVASAVAVLAKVG
jgi:uncharacterized protein (TIGR00369 family)